MYAKVNTAATLGVSAECIWVETDVSRGFPAFSIVGLAGKAVQESRERIRSAVANSGFDFPSARITVNLFPANRAKEGSHFDLPIAISLLLSSGAVDCDSEAIGDTAFLGELTLDGALQRIDGALPLIIGLRENGIKKVIIPERNLEEAMLVRGVRILPARSLSEAGLHIAGEKPLQERIAGGGNFESEQAPISMYEDFSDILGQESVKRACTIAAAGFHSMLMIGPPGVGKTMVGRRLAGILPPMSYEEALDTTRIYSVAGELSEGMQFIRFRPFRSPHHSISASALTGGGSTPKPGEISLAHNGILFLDEFPEFSPYALEMLRKPVEEGKVTVNRVKESCVFPSKFLLVAAMNPCRCGYFGDEEKDCTCNATDRERYMRRASGPLMDRIDMHLRMSRPKYAKLAAGVTCGMRMRKAGESEEMRRQAAAAFEIQKKRYAVDGDAGCFVNSSLDIRGIEKYCSLDSEGKDIMAGASDRWKLSARAIHKVLRLARTIADLDASEDIKANHLLEALTYRMPESTGQ